MERQKFRIFMQQPIAELNIKRKKLNELIALIREASTVPVYISATTEEKLDTCVRRHEAAGFVGTFYCFKSDNMRMSETTLLDTLRDTSRRHYNSHDRSDADSDDGYVYVIVGYCYNSTRPIYQY